MIQFDLKKINPEYLKPKNLVKILYKRLSTISIKPRLISIFILIFGIVLAGLIFTPLSDVFAGRIKVNQKIDIFQDVYIDFERLGVGQIASSIGLDQQYPIGTISIRFYSILILSGLIGGYFLALYFAKLHYISGTVLDRLVVGLVLFGIIGSRLFFAIFNWSYYETQPLSVLTEITSGGLAFFGMLLFCFIYLWFYCFRFKFNFFEILDVLAPSVLLGQIIGRWGNFFNYESYGPETSVFWKMFVPPGAPFYENTDLTARFFHPTFLYEIIPNFFLLVIILFFYEKLTYKRAGLVFATYAIGYGTIRFFTEFFRLDSLKFYLPDFLRFSLPDGIFKVEYILVSQAMCVSLIILGFLIWISRRQVLFLKRKSSEFKI